MPSCSVFAGTDNDVPSCYVANKLPPPALEREISVLVDQTTVFDVKLQGNIRENLGRLIKPGVGYVIGDFSSFGQGKYAEVISAGVLEPPISEDARNDISVKLLRNFDACMLGQSKFGLKTAANALNKAMSANNPNLAKSDVLASLKEFSVRVRKSRARDRVVLIASDMLENSSISSFYAKQTVRKISPEKELENAKRSELIGDFGGAKIYIIGAGLLVEDNNNPKGTYRSPEVMGALSKFWSSWFKESNAELVEFGQPALLNPIK